MKIVLATGGSGGHIFPAIKTAEYLRKQGHEVFFCGALNLVRERLTKAGFDFLVLDVEGFNRRWALRFIIKMFSAVSKVRQWLSVHKPDVVVGFGSYSSFPVVFAANRMKIPTIIHEQNVIPGKANRLAARFVKTMAVSFDETKIYFPKHTIVHTGCPCNSEKPLRSKQELLRSFGLKENRKTILVLGGSQGSHFLNQVFFECLSSLGNVQVIHMTGKTDYEIYFREYSRFDVPYHVCSFIENIQEAYAVSDLVIARAGAATVCELAAFGIPSILIPYPYAQGHQLANAKVLERTSQAVIMEQSQLNAQDLSKKIQLMLESRVLKYSLENELTTHPTQLLAEAICLVQ